VVDRSNWCSWCSFCPAQNCDSEGTRCHHLNRYAVGRVRDRKQRNILREKRAAGRVSSASTIRYVPIVYPLFLSLCINYISSQLALWCRLLWWVLFLYKKEREVPSAVADRLTRRHRMLGVGHFSRSDLSSRFFSFISKQKREWPSPHMLSKEKSILNNLASTPNVQYNNIDGT